MSRSLVSFSIRLILSVLVSLTLYGILRFIPGKGTEWVLPHFHFYVVSLTLVLVAISSLFIGRTGERLRDVNVVMLALGLLMLSGCFLVHGLSTPGFIIQDAHHLAGVSAQLALTLCAIWMFLSTFPSDHPLVRYISRYRHKMISGTVTFVIIFNILALTFPGISDSIPIDLDPLNYAFAILTIVPYLWVAMRYFAHYRITHFPLHGAIVFGSVLLSVTEFIMVSSMMWTPDWWLYHVTLAASAVTVLAGVIAQYKSNVTTTRMVHHPSVDDSGVLVWAGVSSSMQNLIGAVEKEDLYTAGHNFRVAMYALQLADAMRVDPELKKALVRGGVIHDVGKVNVPSSVLNKPGKLTPEERIVIEQHPVTGYELCRYIGFMTEELGVIRHHHEKWDGTGYPDKLKGRDIPMLARILAIADVYDALTSERAYRKPWAHERAMEVILEGSGTHFDPECVTAWFKLCGSKGWGKPAVAEG